MSGDAFDTLIDAREVGVAFQPIVDLFDGEVLGYEALARVPPGTSFEDPGALFAEAYRRDPTTSRRYGILADPLK